MYMPTLVAMASRGAGYEVAMAAALDTPDPTAVLKHWDGVSDPTSFMSEELVPRGSQVRCASTARGVQA